MARLCAFHAAVPASMTCGQCGAPLCAQCTQMVGIVPACAQCAPAIQARQNQLAGVGSGMFQGTASPPANDLYPLRQLYNQTVPGDTSTVPVAAQEPVNPGRNATLGYFIAFVFGTFLSIIMLKIIFRSVEAHVTSHLPVLYSAIGYLIGRTIWKYTGRADIGTIFSAVGIMVLALIIGHIDFAYDILAAAKAAGQADPQITVIAALPQIIKTFMPIHWVYVLIGLVVCGVSAVGVNRQSSYGYRVRID